MKSEEIIFMVFIGIILTAIPLVFWMIRNEEMREKEEEKKRWREQKRKRDEAAKG